MPSDTALIVGAVAGIATTILSTAVLLYREARNHRWVREAREAQEKLIQTGTGHAVAAFREANNLNRKLESLNQRIVDSHIHVALNGARMLLVDDDPSTSRLVRILLVNDGWVVECTTNPDAALQALAVIKPDLVLIDVQLQGVRDAGLVLARKVAQTAPGTAVVIFSASRLPTPIVLAAGAIAAIWKPIDPETFAATLRQYLPRRLTDPIASEPATAPAAPDSSPTAEEPPHS